MNNYEEIIKEAMPYIKEGFEIVKDKAIDEVSKNGIRLFIDWMKSKFIKPSSQEKIKAVEVSATEQNILTLQALLKDAVLDEELDIKELENKISSFKEEIIRQKPSIVNTISNSKNVITGDINLGIGNINIGDIKSNTNK